MSKGHETLYRRFKSAILERKEDDLVPVGPEMISFLCQEGSCWHRQIWLKESGAVKEITVHSMEGQYLD